MNYNEWMEYQRKLPKIDTHEHITTEDNAKKSNVDIFDILLIPYNCDTLQTAGCTRKEWAFLMDKTQAFEERYSILEKYFPYIRYTAFFRAVQKTLKKEYGEDEFSCESLFRADRKLKEQLKSPFYDSILDSLNIKTVLCCSGYDCGCYYNDARVCFIPTVSEILPRTQMDVERLETISGIRIFDLNTFMKALEVLFEQYYKAGVHAIKFGSAYRRNLSFCIVDYEKAEKQLQTVLTLCSMGDCKNNGSIAPCRAYEELTVLDDYLTNYMLTLCERFNFVVVFHVAMHAWNENNPERAHAHYLSNTIQKYSNIKFVLLHSGAPFFEEAVLLARYYPNVYLDLTWFHIISPELVRQAIFRILELVPVNKVFAFGGDYCYLQTLPGHLEIAMENFAIAFEKMCRDKICTEEQAKEILNMWYFENPKRVFKIEI